MSTADGRAAAWIRAWDVLEAAQEMITDQRGRVQSDALPDIYWGFLYTANVLMGLAGVDISVGLMAGDHLDEREANRLDRQNSQTSILDAMKRYEESNKPYGTTAEEGDSDDSKP